MTKEILESLNEVAGKHARKVLLEFKVPLAPTWALLTENGQIEVIGTPWADEQEKHFYAVLLRQLMRQKKVVAYSFLTEAWAASLAEGEWDQETGRPKDGLTASRRPDREEIVIACACSKSQACWRQWRLVREATTERIIDLVDKPFPESENQPESWMANMLR